MRTLPGWLIALALVFSCALSASPAPAAPLGRPQALAALSHADPATRLLGLERLADLGLMADVGRVLERLSDDQPQVREAAATTAWRIWSRSGDTRIDRLFAQGVMQMQQAALYDALTTFSEIVRRKPEFAEGWNKRATVLFMLGENEKSLKDCDEVFRLNPDHFGALSGAGQIHLKLGNPRLALEFFRRAYAVNPNLRGLEQVIPALEQQLRDEDRNKT